MGQLMSTLFKAVLQSLQLANDLIEFGRLFHSISMISGRTWGC